MYVCLLPQVFWMWVQLLPCSLSSAALVEGPQTTWGPFKKLVPSGLKLVTTPLAAVLDISDLKWAPGLEREQNFTSSHRPSCATVVSDKRLT